MRKFDICGSKTNNKADDFDPFDKKTSRCIATAAALNINIKYLTKNIIDNIIDNTCILPECY